MTTKLEVGDKAPDFELQSTTGDKLRLSEDPTRLPDIDQIKKVLAKIQKSISN